MHVWARGVYDTDLFDLSREPVLLPEQFAPLLEELQDLRDEHRTERVRQLETELDDLRNELEDAEKEVSEQQDRIEVLEAELKEAGVLDG